MGLMNNSAETRAHGAVTAITLSRADVRNAVDAAIARKHGIAYAR
jgi:hypothetical protein